MNAHGARHLRQPGDGFFHVAGIEHHQVGQLVDDDDNVRNRLVFGVFFEQTRRAILFEQAVVLIDIAYAFGSQQLQPPFHLTHRIAQRISGQLGFCNNRSVKMGHAFVVPELQAFGIYQNQAHLIRRGLIQNRHDHGVDGHALTCARRTGN